MSTSFPGALDDFTNPSGSQSLAAGGHSQLHADLNDAVEALEAKVGADSSAVTTSHDYLLAQLAGNLLLGAGEISITGATTATIGRMHVLSGTAADYTVFLPPPAGNAMKLIGFRTSPLLTKLVTLVGTGEPGTGTGSIDHAAARTMWANGEETEAAILLCDGADWFKVAGKTVPMQAIMYLSANQTGVVTATVTKALIDTTVTDNTGLMADTTNKRINVVRSSMYMVSGAVTFGGATGGNGLDANSVRTLTQLQLTGAGFANAECSGLAGGYPTPFAVKPKAAVVGDRFELFGHHNQGSNGHFYGSSGQETHLAVTEVPQW